MTNMYLDEYNYLWTTKKDEYVLVNTSHGYGIVNKKEQTFLLMSDDDLSKAVVQKMLDEGNKTYDNILSAYADV